MNTNEDDDEALEPIKDLIDDLAAARTRVSEMDAANARLLARIAELEAERDALTGAGQALEDRVFELEAKLGLGSSVAGENDEHREMRP